MKDLISKKLKTILKAVSLSISDTLVSTNDFSTIVNEGCIYFKQEEYENAYERFSDAIKISGFNAELYYNISLCLYELSDFKGAKKYLNQIVE